MSKPPMRPTHTSGAAAAILQNAVAAMKARRPAIAEALALEVLKADAENILAVQILGEALLLQDRAREAANVLKASASRATDPGVETLLAMALTALGQDEAALESLRLATTRRPPFPLAFLELGERLGAKGAYDEAVAVLELGVRLAPEAHILRLSLGRLHLALNARDAAKALFAEVLERAPDLHAGLTAMAKVLALGGENTSAVALYQRALELRPDDALAAICLAKCLLETGARQEGEAMLRAVVGRDPSLTGPALTALATTTHGRLFARPSEARRFMGL